MGNFEKNLDLANNPAGDDVTEATRVDTAVGVNVVNDVDRPDETNGEVEISNANDVNTLHEEASCSQTEESTDDSFSSVFGDQNQIVDENDSDPDFVVNVPLHVTNDVRRSARERKLKSYDDFLSYLVSYENNDPDGYDEAVSRDDHDKWKAA